MLNQLYPEVIERGNMLLQVTDNEFSLIKKMIYERAGIRLNETKKVLVSNRLRKRLSYLGFRNYRIYCNYILKAETKEARKELIYFIDALTTNETYFFRNPKQLKYLEKNIMPKIIMGKNRGIRRIRIWSAACSSGEEPYTIAILLREIIKNYDDWDIQIVASDINKDVIRKAAEGIYKPYAVERMPRNYLNKYFIRDKKTGYFILAEKIKKMVQYYNHNLLHPFYLKRIDLIFCRNALIYFDNKSKKKVCSNISSSLVKGGYLFLGHAETLLDNKLMFKYVKPAIYEKI